MAKQLKKKTKATYFLAKARARMERKGTVGSLTRLAKKAGKSIGEYCRTLPERATTTVKRKCAFYKAVRKIARNR